MFVFSSYICLGVEYAPFMDIPNVEHIHFENGTEEHRYFLHLKKIIFNFKKSIYFKQCNFIACLSIHTSNIIDAMTQRN